MRWVDVSQDMVDSYNNSHHRSIGMAPDDVQRKDENRLWVRLFVDGDTHLKPPIPQGSMVRASSYKTIWYTVYMPNWANKHFTMSQAVPPRRGIESRVYKLVDYKDEAVKGSWYPKELQEISDIQYRIEKVLRRRTLFDGTKELFGRWEGWPDNYNCWIKETDKYNVVD